MAGDHPGVAAIRRLVYGQGTTVALTKQPADLIYNPATRKVTSVSGTARVANVKGVVRPVTEEMFDGVAVQVKDVLVLVSEADLRIALPGSLPYVPANGDTIVIDPGVALKVEHVMTMRRKQSVTGYDLLVRGGQ